MPPVVGVGALVGWSPNAGALNAPIALDHFTDSDGTNLTAHTPDVDTVGGGWIATTGTVTIQSNKADEGGGGATTVYVIDVGVADVVIEAVVEPGSNGQTGLTARLTDASNYWLCRWDQGASELQLFEINAGGATKRAGASLTAGTSRETHTLRVTCSGQTITVLVVEEGVSASYASASHNAAATKHGLRGRGLNGAWDNFRVDAA